MSYQACMTCVYMHGAHALSNFGMPMYFRWVVYMQADQNLGKITASHFGVLITQNANMNMPNMILIAELNKNLPDCNENLGWVGNENPSFIPTSPGIKQSTRSWSKLHVTFISCSNHKIKSIQLQFYLNSNTQHLLRAVQVLFPVQDHPNSQFGCPIDLCVCKFDCCLVFCLNSNPI